MKHPRTNSSPTLRISRSQQSTGDAPELTAVAPVDALPAGLVEDDEIIILFLRPSPLYIILGSLGRLLVIAVITLALMYVGRRFTITNLDTIAFAFGVTIGLAQLVWQGLEWWSRLYILTDRRIIRQKGALRPVVFQAKLRDIKHTSVFQKLRERAMGLGSIGFAATGSDVFDAFWTMIPDPFTVHKTVVEAIERYGRH